MPSPHKELLDESTSREPLPIAREVHRYLWGFPVDQWLALLLGLLIVVVSLIWVSSAQLIARFMIIIVFAELLIWQVELRGIANLDLEPFDNGVSYPKILGWFILLVVTFVVVTGLLTW